MTGRRKSPPLRPAAPSDGGRARALGWEGGEEEQEGRASPARGRAEGPLDVGTGRQPVGSVAGEARATEKGTEAEGSLRARPVPARPGIPPPPPRSRPEQTTAPPADRTSRTTCGGMAMEDGGMDVEDGGGRAASLREGTAAVEDVAAVGGEGRGGMLFTGEGRCVEPPDSREEKARGRRMSGPPARCLGPHAQEAPGVRCSHDGLFGKTRLRIEEGRPGGKRGTRGECAQNADDGEGRLRHRDIVLSP